MREEVTVCNFNYDSYCGIYCGACDIHLACKTGHKDHFTSVWKEPVLRAFQKAQGNTGLASEALQLKCHGCKSGTVFINCRTCKIRSCAIDKKIDHCIDCTDYPCALHAGMKKMGGILPHVNNNLSNLEAIKKAGVEQWLGDQEKRWKCPDCQTRFAWYWSTCRTCGRKLTGSSYEFSKVKALLLRFGIRLASLRKGQ